MGLVLAYPDCKVVGLTEELSGPITVAHPPSVRDLPFADTRAWIDQAVPEETPVPKYFPRVATFHKPHKLGQGVQRAFTKVRKIRSPVRIAPIFLDRNVVGDAIIREIFGFHRPVQTLAENLRRSLHEEPVSVGIFVKRVGKNQTEFAVRMTPAVNHGRAKRTLPSAEHCEPASGAIGHWLHLSVQV